MKPVTLTLLPCLLITALACAGREAARDANPPKPPAAAATENTPAPAAQVPQSKTCALLSAEELKEVQGEAPTDAQGSEHTAESLSMSQCFYRLPTFGKSVSLEVVSAPAGAQPGALKEYWRKRFHPDAVEEREHMRERDEEAKLRREEEAKREREAGQLREGGRRKKNREEEHWRPQRVAGVGDEAFWTGNQKMWTLAVLRGERAVRVTLAGSPEEQAENLKRATEVARKVLKRL